jgi:hypothetical protein
MSASDHIAVQLGTIFPDESKYFSVEQLDELYRLETLGHSVEVLDLLAKARENNDMPKFKKISAAKFKYLVNPRILNQIYTFGKDSFQPTLTLEHVISFETESMSHLSELSDKIIATPNLQNAEKSGRKALHALINYYSKNKTKLGEHYFKSQVSFINDAASDFADEIRRKLSNNDNEKPHKVIIPIALETAAEHGKYTVIEAMLNNDLVKNIITKDDIMSASRSAVGAGKVKCIEAIFNNQDINFKMSFKDKLEIASIALLKGTAKNLYIAGLMLKKSIFN